MMLNNSLTSIRTLRQCTKYTIDNFKACYKQTRNNLTQPVASLPSLQHRKSRPCCNNIKTYDRHFSHYPLLLRGRTLHTSANNNENQKIHTKFLQLRNPLRYLSLKIKLFLLRSYFDQDFNEDQFIIGAKQAVSFVSTKISEGKINDLDDVLTSEGVQSCRDLYDANHGNPDSLRVDMDDFMNITMADIGFDYGEKGEKFANVLVVCFCLGKRSATRTFGNIDVVTMPTRILKYSDDMPWIKKQGGLFDVTMGAYDGAEVCELVSSRLHTWHYI